MEIILVQQLYILQTDTHLLYIRLEWMYPFRILASTLSLLTVYCAYFWDRAHVLKLGKWVPEQSPMNIWIWPSKICMVLLISLLHIKPCLSVSLPNLNCLLSANCHRLKNTWQKPGQIPFYITGNLYKLFSRRAVGLFCWPAMDVSFHSHLQCTCVTSESKQVLRVMHTHMVIESKARRVHLHTLSYWIWWRGQGHESSS